MSKDVEVALKELAASTSDNCLKLGSAHVAGMQVAAQPFCSGSTTSRNRISQGMQNVLVAGARSAINRCCLLEFGASQAGYHVHTTTN